MKKDIARIIEQATGTSNFALSVPEREEFGHYATNVALQLAQEKGGGPHKLAEELKEKIETAAPKELFERIEIAGPGFINFWLSPSAVQNAFKEISQKKEYGTSESGQGETVIVEYSQPNIAKQTHAGHLRTTIIGDALANIHEALGYKVVRWNYLGDWGTQFGKVIVAYREWGSKEEVEKKPVEALEELYARFHREAEENPSLEERAREEFRKLEEGDPENRKLWEWFRDVSIKEIEEVYNTLGITFDTYKGEAFFENAIAPLLERLTRERVAEESEGALIVRLDEANLPPALVRKSDGASVYLTRDIAALEYRLKEYAPKKLLYVVGNEQALHFAQLLTIAEKLGVLGSAQVEHVKYGLLLGEGKKKMSTRKGTSVHLKGLIEEIIARAREVVEEKNPELSGEEKQEIAQVIGVGALKYNDLKENRLSDVVFDWKKMLDFTGNSAPYIQYTYTRLVNIIAKSGEDVSPAHADIEKLTGEKELALMRKIFEFPYEVERSGNTLFTNNLAEYLYGLAGLANQLYETTPVLKEKNAARRGALLGLISKTAEVLERGLGLLGIEVLPRM